MSLLKNSLTFPGKYSCWVSLFNAAASLIPATALKNDSSTGAFLCIYQNFKNAKHPRIGKFKGKVRYWSPGPVEESLVTLFITGLYQEDLQKNIRTLCFGTDIQQNNFEALYH